MAGSSMTGEGGDGIGAGAVCTSGRAGAGVGAAGGGAAGIVVAGLGRGGENGANPAQPPTMSEAASASTSAGAARGKFAWPAVMRGRESP